MNAFQQAPDAPSPAMAQRPTPMQSGGPSPMPNMMGASPQMQQQPVAPQGPPPSPDQIMAARRHFQVFIDDMLKLVSMPQGKLDKKAVFDAASDMIAKGAFSTAQSKQQLIGELANLPDDEPDLRKALGGFLLQAVTYQDQINQKFGVPNG